MELSSYAQLCCLYFCLFQRIESICPLISLIMMSASSLRVNKNIV
ncbi:hypothetical protein PREVCOP_04782 [Segatella copri DSM 18205]|uniref:Uncharacterized protein n=1 Tax=Segatella copri DSM 18205 TaxID=537011 RepID=D1PC51_9BACT|nr:hypothetical protein PREVCOP_04782 [Segatella copri DSM 18205]